MKYNHYLAKTTSENQELSDSRRSNYYSIIMFRSFVFIPFLPSRHTLFIGDGVTVGGFLRVGSYRVTACEVIVVDNEVMVIIDADRAGAVGVVEGAKGILYILYDRFLDLA